MKQIKVAAPGRINLIGEHTDYNDGFVLPGAIDRTIQQNIIQNGTNETCRLHSVHYNESISFELSNINQSQKQWANYLLGVVVEIEKRSDKLKGFDCSFDGDIPIGGGVSSSSALQVSFVFALNELFELGFSKIEMAIVCQDADHNFIGMKGGIMDQFASLHGREDQVMLLDCRSLEYQYFPLELGKYQLLLLNTNVAHSLADSEYNTRRAECEEGVEQLREIYPQITSLRDINEKQLLSAKNHLDNIIYNRCHHVVMENRRTIKATECMTSGRTAELGHLIYASHESLSLDYEVSCVELDFLVEHSIGLDYVLGSRMMGGGFGGCTISLVEKSKVKEYIQLSSEVYRERFSLDLTPLEVKVAGGATVSSR